MLGFGEKRTYFRSDKDENLEEESKIVGSENRFNNFTNQTRYLFGGNSC